MNETKLLNFIEFVGDTMFLYGLYKHSLNEKMAAPWLIQFSELGISWFRNQRGAIKVHIDVESRVDRHRISDYRPSNELVVGYIDICKHDPEAYDELLSDINEINGLLLKIFPGIRLRNNYCNCQSDLHEPNIFPSFCKLYNELWICEKCYEKQEKINEQEQQKRDDARTQFQIERDLMKASLRYQILKRDHFTCQACGRSPKTETGVRLHVDHIIPVSKGGKTDLDNLQTLCDLCNFGKSTS